MKERRWDIVLRVVSGPMASREPQVFRGPQVTAGTQPGPGGVVLPGGRGIAPQHCTITAYDPHTVFVTPVGHNPVRLAPYPDVRWEELEPVSGRVRLARGNAIHLGPTGQRGVTLEFVECRDLGMQSVVQLASEWRDDLAVDRPPDGIQARTQRPQVRTLVTETFDPTTFRVLMGLLLGGTALFLVVAAVLVIGQFSKPPAQEGHEFWTVQDFDFQGQLATAFVDAKYEGFAKPVFNFVVEPDRQYAGDPAAHPELFAQDPRGWDPRFFGQVVRMVKQWSRHPNLYKRFDEVKDHYSKVTRILREEGMPEVFAGIPMWESCYKPEPVSPCCAKGWWQFMPEAGVRFRNLPGFGSAYDVRACTWKDTPGAEPYSPDEPAPVPGSCNPTSPKAPYVNPGPSCMLGTCKTDFRTDLALSTKAAVYNLKEVLQDPILRASGAVVQIGIASHNAGYDDARMFKKDPPRKPFNLLPAYSAWYRSKPDSTPAAHFYSDVMRCATKDDISGGCQKFMMYETQRYSVTVVAYHFLAVCYYARNYPQDPAFAPWVQYLEKGEYCSEINVPAAPEIAEVNSRPVCPG